MEGEKKPPATEEVRWSRAREEGFDLEECQERAEDTGWDSNICGANSQEETGNAKTKIEMI